MISKETGIIAVWNEGRPVTIGKIDFPNIGAVVRAFRANVDISILSTPQVATFNSEEAEIIVADNIPFPNRQLIELIFAGVFPKPLLHVSTSYQLKGNIGLWRLPSLAFIL